MKEREVISSPDLPPAKGPYSPAIRAGGFVFVSGLGPIDPGTGAVSQAGFEDQVGLVMENLARVLKAAGSSLEQVVKTTVYLRDMNDFPRLNAVYAAYFPKDPPARTTIQAGKLPLDMAVEIDAIALGGD
jgi:2-iminobutanoate/2-iminopropanoate deaminase